GQGFSFTWDSLGSAVPGLPTAANYIDQESGHILWTRINNRERLTLSLNTDPSQLLDIEANADIRDCSLVNHCQCSYVALYELRSDGYLREVSVVCGRTSQVKLQNLFPNILAFVYLNSSDSVSAKDYAEIKWNASKLDCTSTTMSSSPTTRSTTDLPVKIYTRTPYSGFSIDLVSYGMEIYYDGLTIYSWNASGIVTTKRIEQTDYNSTISVNQPYGAIAFTSDYMGPSRGFQVTITGTGDLQGKHHSRGLWLNQTEGSLSYPGDVGVFNYEPNERVTVVIQPPSVKTRTVVSIDEADIKKYDTLTLYQLNPYHWSGTANLVARINGSDPGNVNVSSIGSDSNFPRLLLFHSNDNSEVGKGFFISWKPVLKNEGDQTETTPGHRKSH
ncbi:unnamed protein product, partial [Allacma fusca]